MLKPFARALLYSLMLSIDSTAAAVDLNDPTRPSGFTERASKSPETESAEVLSLTLIRLGSAPLAVINGVNVRPGERVGGYRLLSLQPGAATLAGAAGTLVLKLSPATLHKSPVMPTP